MVIAGDEAGFCKEMCSWRGVRPRCGGIELERRQPQRRREDAVAEVICRG